MSTKTFARVSLAASAAQVGMVVGGHYSAAVAGAFGLGGLAISLLAGAFYARLSNAGWIGALAGGLLSGAACAFLGIGVSVFLGDVPWPLLVFGTAGSAVAGLIGGVAGKLTAPRPSVTG